MTQTLMTSLRFSFSRLITPTLNGHWEDYGLTEMPVSSVHSHPDEPNTFEKERSSMSHDYNNVKNEVEKYGRQMRLNNENLYFYFYDVVDKFV